MGGTITRATLALLASALVFGPSAAQAGNQLFEASWTVKAFSNERTDGTTTPSTAYSAIRIPQGIQCNRNQPRCPFVSTPTDGDGNFKPLGGSQVMALFCAPWENFGGKGTNVRPAKGATVTTGGPKKRPLPPLYRNPRFFTPSGAAGTTYCAASSTGATPDGKGLVQAGHPVTGTWAAATTFTSKGGFDFSFGAAPAAANAAGFRTTGQAGEFSAYYPYVYSYTYATFRNDKGIFGKGKGPGNFSHQIGWSNRSMVRSGGERCCPRADPQRCLVQLSPSARWRMGSHLTPNLELVNAGSRRTTRNPIGASMPNTQGDAIEINKERLHLL